ncbi:MAG: hypothetical protein ACRDD1_12425, partial [Planctomycetia bacterium]
PFTGGEVIDPDTGKPLVKTRHFATGYSNFLRLENVPVFYAPYLRADVEDPLGPLEAIQVGNSRNLGTFGSVTLDVWQLLRLDYLPAAENSDWLLDLGYYSDRGFGGGTRYQYLGTEFLGLPGRNYGSGLIWGINDHGMDQLGAGRFDLTPPREERGRFTMQHRQELSEHWSLIAEVSYLSDMNFLESFFEAEYDYGKDQETLLYAKYVNEHRAFTALVQPRVNHFLPQNAMYPRLDGYILGAPLLQDRLTYFSHSSLLYTQIRPPEAFPLQGSVNPFTGVQTVMPDARVDTGRFDSRHEVDLPFNLGPVRVVPFLVGQFTGYSNGLNEEDAISRFYGATGARVAMPFWRTFPSVQSDLFYLNGLAHKVTVGADYLLAESDEDFRNLPQVDQVDDDTSELVRRQNYIRQFGGFTPITLDPRFYALQRNVTFIPDILDDMNNLRVYLDQRLQTKRGPVDAPYIVDWMILDAGFSVFPDADRDNFGDQFGIFDAEYQWRLGDRTILSANTVYRPSDENITLSGSLLITRPPRTQIQFFGSHVDAGDFT